jgi:hypothetical protein
MHAPILHAEVNEKDANTLQLRLQGLVLQLECHVELIRKSRSCTHNHSPTTNMTTASPYSPSWLRLTRSYQWPLGLQTTSQHLHCWTKKSSCGTPTSEQPTQKHNNGLKTTNSQSKNPT